MTATDSRPSVAAPGLSSPGEGGCTGEDDVEALAAVLDPEAFSPRSVLTYAWQLGERQGLARRMARRALDAGYRPPGSS